MQMILGLIFAAIFVYVGVNLEPGLNTTVATITTPTYSSGVAGLNGVIMIVFAAMIIFGINNSSPLMQRCIRKTLNIGENLKWQRRGIAHLWEARNDYQGATLAIEPMA